MLGANRWCVVGQQAETGAAEVSWCRV